MSSLQELVNKLKPSKGINQSYIYYDTKNGKIHKISGVNRPDDRFAIFPIPTNEVTTILSGERRTEDFIIHYDVSSKQVRLKELSYDDELITASTLSYQLPIIKNTYEGHYTLSEIYEGVDVFLWSDSVSYVKGQSVWHNNNVYRLESNVTGTLDVTMHKLMLDNVSLTDLPTQSHTTEVYSLQPEYVGMHIDVWYKELSHLAGQHVWLNGNVYKILKDSPADTEFTMDNATVIIENVLLSADENKSLPTNNTQSNGDTILHYNNIYSVVLTEQEFKKDKTSIFFYQNSATIQYVLDDSCTILNIHDSTSTTHDNILSLTPSSDLTNGQSILCGKRLYQLHTSKEYDIIVKQNTIDCTWNMVLNPYTKKFLKTTGHLSNETLYFSVT